MTLEELFCESGISIEGPIKIQYFDMFGTPTILYEGQSELFCVEDHENISKREVAYMYPYMEREENAAICIELKDYC